LVGFLDDEGHVPENPIISPGKILIMYPGEKEEVSALPIAGAELPVQEQVFVFRIVNGTQFGQVGISDFAIAE
jgi:hypothetical protein